MEFFENMEPLLRIFWYIAIPCSLILIIQITLVLIGNDLAANMDIGKNENNFSALSLLTFNNFMLGFSWTGILLFDFFDSKLLLTICAFSFGISVVWFFLMILKKVQKTEENKHFQIIDTVGKTAKVFSKIPQNMQGKGKIVVKLNSSTHKLEAATLGPALETGTIVNIIDIGNTNLLIVQKN